MPSADLNRHFMSYAALGFGLPLIMALLVLWVDLAAGKVAAQKFRGTSEDSFAYDVRTTYISFGTTNNLKPSC